MNVVSLFNQIDRIRALEGDMTLRRLLLLLLVYKAGPDGISLANLIKSMSATPSNVTKIVQSWSHRTATREKGPGYLTAESDPMNLTNKVVRMTDRGRRATAALLAE